jgi:hypothetical protein
MDTAYLGPPAEEYAHYYEMSLLRYVDTYSFDGKGQETLTLVDLADWSEPRGHHVGTLFNDIMDFYDRAERGTIQSSDYTSSHLGTVVVLGLHPLSDKARHAFDLARAALASVGTRLLFKRLKSRDVYVRHLMKVAKGGSNLLLKPDPDPDPSLGADESAAPTDEIDSEESIH